MTSQQDLIRAYRTAKGIQADADEILHKVVDNSPVVFATSEPQRGRPWLTVQVEPEVLLMHAAARDWSANRNRTGSKFYLLDGDGREIGIMYNEPDTQLLCQAVNEYHGLCRVEQARVDAVAVIQRYETMIDQLERQLETKTHTIAARERELSEKDGIITRLQLQNKRLGDQLEQDQADLARYQTQHGAL